jgi:hypothetical protein
MKRFGVPQNIEIARFAKRSVQHLVAHQEYLFVNNSENNINVYYLNHKKIVKPDDTKQEAKIG